MGMEVVDIQPRKSGGLEADRALYADAALSVLLDARDARASVQIASRAGKQIPAEYVQALSLELDSKGRVVQKAKQAKQAAPAEDKQAAPKRNKAAKPKPAKDA